MQAARGASLTSSDAGTTATGRRSTRTLFLVVALTAYALDIGSKIWAVARLSDGDIEVLGDWFVLHLVRNPGAAFSTGTQYTVVFSVVAIVAACVVLWLGRKVGSTIWAIAFGLLLGGICGNLTDRILRDPGPLRGHVVDLFMIPHWPVFNIADVCIDVAAGLILLQAFRNVRPDGTRVHHGRSEEETA
jgi:signal peptidase II